MDCGNCGEKVSEGKLRVEGCKLTALRGGGRSLLSSLVKSGDLLLGIVRLLEALPLLGLSLLLRHLSQGRLALRLLLNLLFWRWSRRYDGAFRLEGLRRRDVSIGPAGWHVARKDGCAPRTRYTKNMGDVVCT